MLWFFCLSLPGAGEVAQGSTKEPLAIPIGKIPCLGLAER